MFDIVRRVIQSRGQKETSVTLLEDLHWFDEGSAAFLEPLISVGAGTRSLVLLNFRPEYQAPWMGKSYYHQLPLSPLGPDAIRELLEALLGHDPSTAGLAAAIHARTAGNPFFTEEVVQTLIESGKLQGSKGAYRLVTPLDRLEVPSSVHAVLAARIDRLAARDKDVLQTAAVIGRTFDEPTLAAVVEQDAPQLREALQMLKDTEFVYEHSLYPVAEYLFKHPLTQEVALASQLQERRRRLHAVARVIEAAHAGLATSMPPYWRTTGKRPPIRPRLCAGTCAPQDGPPSAIPSRACGIGGRCGSSAARSMKWNSRRRGCTPAARSSPAVDGASHERRRGAGLPSTRPAGARTRRPAATVLPAGYAVPVEGRLTFALPTRRQSGSTARTWTQRALLVECTSPLCRRGGFGTLSDGSHRPAHGGDPHAGRELTGFARGSSRSPLARWRWYTGVFDECWPRFDRYPDGA
jgi:hypothetical protein